MNTITKRECNQLLYKTSNHPYSRQPYHKQGNIGYYVASPCMQESQNETQPLPLNPTPNLDSHHTCQWCLLIMYIEKYHQVTESFTVQKHAQYLYYGTYCSQSWRQKM